MGLAEVETTFAEKSVTGKKLKIKILAKKPLTSPCDKTKQVPVRTCLEKSSSADNQNTTYSNIKVNCSILGSKRMLEEGVELQKEKKVKMDRSTTSNCLAILGKLMKHQNGYLFNEPVDPVKLGIPDYFEIIKKPMDLGTIKRKVERNIYKNVEDFEYDVRLTFSNAVRYNPPDNWVHLVAKKMMAMYDKLWKSVKEKMNRPHESMKELSSEKRIHTFTYDGSKKCVRNLSSHADKLPGDTEDGKAKGHKSSKGCMPDPDSGGLVPCLREENSCTLSAHPQILHVKPEQAVLMVKCENAARSVNKAPRDELKAVDVKHTRTSQISRSDPDSDGCESCLDEELACSTSVASTTEGLETVLDIQLSPTKALRAAMLKSRFADTILKAQHKTLLQPGDKPAPMKLQQEKERLERRQREEKARIEAQVRAAESAARFKAEAELKKQREQQREAARLALEKMERSIDLDDNFHTLRELEALIGSNPLFVLRHCRDGKSYTVFDAFEKGKLRSPLERLGLFIKAEFMLGDDDEDAFLQEGDWEEGELLF